MQPANSEHEALLLKQGWTMYYSCMCGGSLRKHWTNTRYPGYDIRTRPTRTTFSILNRNVVIHGPNYLYNLQSKLTEYEIFDTELV